MANTRLPLPLSQVIDKTGRPIVGAKVYFYIGGTTTLITTYSNVDLVMLNTNPLITDSYGLLGDVFIQATDVVDIVYKTASDVVIKEYKALSVQSPINTNGNLQINTGSVSNNYHQLGVNSTSEGDPLLVVAGNGSPVVSFNVRRVDGGGINSSNSAIGLQKNSTNNRSINAAGTINASGADYAEYVKKSPLCRLIKKGDIAGVNADGELTHEYNESVQFLIKSTNPNLVGGDNWAYDIEQEALDIERAKYDRMAFCGIVPMNTNVAFSVGDYIIPVKTQEGTIGALFEQSPKLEQYMRCVGRVWAINSDGRPLVNVKVG